MSAMDKRGLSERDICTKFITPALRKAGWDEMVQIRRAMQAALLPMPLLILPGCATTTASVATYAVACSAFDPIWWSSRNTDETIRQAKEHNAAWASICGRTAPVPR